MQRIFDGRVCYVKAPVKLLGRHESIWIDCLSFVTEKRKGFWVRKQEWRGYCYAEARDSYTVYKLIWGFIPWKFAVIQISFPNEWKSYYDFNILYYDGIGF